MFCARVQLSVHIPFSSRGLYSIQPDAFQAGRMCHEPKCPFYSSASPPAPQEAAG